MESLWSQYYKMSESKEHDRLCLTRQWKRGECILPLIPGLMTNINYNLCHLFKSYIYIWQAVGHSSAHTYFFYHTLKALWWLPCWALNNSFFFSFLPNPILLCTFFHLFFHFQNILTFLLLDSASFSRVLFPFHSFALVILFCTTSTLPTSMPPTERKKCIHNCWPSLLLHGTW